MKTKLIYGISVACMLLFPILSFGQTTVRPKMGTTENFVLFTSGGALASTGASQLTHITGDVSSDTAPLTTNLGNIDGTIYITTDGAAVQCAEDLVDLYDELFGLTQDDDLPTSLGGDPFSPGVYRNIVATTLEGNLILDANGDPEALFIFIIEAPGTFTTGANSSMELINDAQACNVFWLVGGAVSFGAGSIIKGTFVSAAAISFGPESELEGRALTKSGAIAIDNGVIRFSAQKPIGCGSTVLTGPAAPDLKTAGCFALFTGSGSMENSGISHIVGDVGSHTAAPTGFDGDTEVEGTVHAGPIDETTQAVSDLSDAFNSLNDDIPIDIELIAPALFGHNLILTPHKYLLAAETHLTGDLYLDAQGNPDAVFVIKVGAAFFTAVGSKVLLINEAKAENVYWLVTGAVSIEEGSFFEGTIVATGAVELKSEVILNGRALTKTGDFSTVAIKATSPGCDTAPLITTHPLNQEVCGGGLANFTVEATGTDLTYQWRIGTVDLDDLTENISGATTATLTIDPVALSDAASDYNVVVTGSVDPFTATSDNASLIVNTAPEITVQPSNQVACDGGTVNFTVEATGADLEYQWRKGTVDLVDNTKISGATSPTLTIYSVDASDEATDYNVIISGTCLPDVTSSNASLMISDEILIVTHPADQVGCEGASVSFSVIATGTDLTYQWRIGEVDLSNTGNISGTTTATLTIDPVALFNADADYNVVVSGECGSPVTSNNASLVVKTSPEITEQPTDQTISVGGVANFSVTAIGTDLTYQWRKGSVDLTVNENISGVTSSTLIIDPVSEADAAEDYNVVVSGGCDPAVTSVDVTLTVTPTGITLIDSENQLTLYPNPFKASVNIKLNGELYGEKYELLIYNALGELVAKTIITEQITVLETSQFASGIYFYQVIGKDKVIQSGKLIKQK